MDQAAGAVDLFVDGALAMNGGQAQVNVSPGYVTAYQYLAPGTHTIAVVPTGKGLAQATTAPLDVPMVAGHRYLVAFRAQAAAGSVKPLLIDETEAAAKAGRDPEGLGHHHAERLGRDNRTQLPVGRQDRQR